MTICLYIIQFYNINNEQKIAITARTNLTEEEIQAAVKEAEAHAAEDKKKKDENEKSE